MPFEELEKRLKAEKAHQQTVDNTVQLSADRTTRALGVAESIYYSSGLKQFLDKFKVLVGRDAFYNLHNPDPNKDPLKAVPGTFRHLLGRRRDCFYDAATWPLPLYQAPLGDHGLLIVEVAPEGTISVLGEENHWYKKGGSMVIPKVDWENNPQSLERALELAHLKPLTYRKSLGPTTGFGLG